MELVYDKTLNDYVCCAGSIPWSVRSVEPRSDYSMLLEFADGTMREFDFKPLLKQEIFRELSDSKRFMRARAEHGTVDWGNEIDISPEYLYENSTVV